MIEEILETDIVATERRLGVALPYMREIARVAPDLLDRLTQITNVAQYAEHAPRDIRHLAALGATTAQDCGACVQIGVNLALADGVEPELLRTALSSDEAAPLTEEQADAFEFGRAVAVQSPDTDVLRQRLRERHGDAAVVSLSWAIAVAQFYPILKRAMGFAQTCSAYGVTVEA